MTNFSDMIGGYRRFRETGYKTQRERWGALAEGQSPRVMVIACSDSRVDPAMIFDVSPGEIFVVRNIANLVPPFEPDGGRHGVSAAIEFAVTQLEVPEIVVMGHGQCGGVHAALTQSFAGKAPGEGGFIGRWVDMIEPARDRVVAEMGDGDDARRELEFETVRLSLTNIRTFPFVADREAADQLALRGAHFAIRDGLLRVMDDSGAFVDA